MSLSSKLRPYEKQHVLAFRIQAFLGSSPPISPGSNVPGFFLCRQCSNCFSVHYLLNRLAHTLENEPIHGNLKVFRCCVPVCFASFPKWLYAISSSNTLLLRSWMSMHCAEVGWRGGRYTEMWRPIRANLRHYTSNFVDYIHTTYEHTKFHCLPLATHPRGCRPHFIVMRLLFPRTTFRPLPVACSGSSNVLIRRRDTAKVLSLHSASILGATGAGIVFSRAENRQKQAANAEVGVIRFCTDYCQNYGRHSIKRIRASSAAFSRSGPGAFCLALAAGHFHLNANVDWRLVWRWWCDFVPKWSAHYTIFTQPFQSTFMASLCTTYTECSP